VNRDPIGIVDDVNLYVYVGNNPLKWVDPTGLAAKEFIKVYDRYLTLESLIKGYNISLNPQPYSIYEKWIKEFEEV
jgi:hypothetical protein